jgi:hypothetical protein
MSVVNIGMYLYGRGRCKAACTVQRRVVDIVEEHLTFTIGDGKFYRIAYWRPDYSRNVKFSIYTYKKNPVGLGFMENDIRNYVIIHHS